MKAIRMLGTEDITALMECGYTLMDVKSMSDQEIMTVLSSVEDYDEKKVQESEHFNIWGMQPAF